MQGGGEFVKGLEGGSCVSPGDQGVVCLESFSEAFVGWSSC